MEQFIYGIVAGLVLAYFVAQIVIWQTMRQIRQRMDVDELIKQLETRVEEAVIQVRIEEHQGEFFVYNIENDQFLAQGRDAASLKAAVESRSDGRTVLITEGDKDVIERFRGTIAKADSA